MKYWRFPPTESWALVGLALIGFAGLAYFLGAYVFRASAQELEVVQLRQSEQIEELLRRKEALMVDRTMAERRLEVSLQTQEYLRDMLQANEGELRKLREELEMFRMITGPGKTDSLAIHTLEMLVRETGGHWGYRLVLYQSNFANVMQGSYDLVLHGHSGGRPQQHRLSTLLGDGEQQTFSFRHFAVLDGEFWLPEDFEAERVEVQVKKKGAQKAFSKSFSWRQAMTDSG